jgi:hypothetical protein
LENLLRTTTFGEFVKDPDSFSEKSYQDLKQTETFFIPAFYQAHDYEGKAHDYEGNSLPDFVPHSAWAELEIAHRSRVKAVYQKIEIFSTSDYAAQLKWIPIYLGEFDIKRFPQVIIDSLELSEDAVARTALSASLVTQSAADALLNTAIGADVFRGNTGFDANTNLSINDFFAVIQDLTVTPTCQLMTCKIMKQPDG